MEEEGSKRIRGRKEGWGDGRGGVAKNRRERRRGRIVR